MHSSAIVCRKVADQLVIARFEIESQRMSFANRIFSDFINHFKAWTWLFEMVARKFDFAIRNISLHDQELMTYRADIGNNECDVSSLGFRMVNLNRPLFFSSYNDV